jgi:gas vesicle protein
MGRYDDYDDDRVVIVERESGGSGLGALLLGLAIGAGAALLLAPDSGEATRARIRREARRAQEKARDKYDELSDEIADTYERTLEAVERKVGKARGAVKQRARVVGDAVSEKAHAVGDAVAERARAVGDAVDAGRTAARVARDELERSVDETKRAYSEARRSARVDDLELRDGPDSGASGTAESA